MQPAPKTQELTDRLNALVDSKERNQFARKALEREIDSLQKVDAVGAFMLRGGLAAFFFEEELARKSFENAMRLEPSNVLVISNYALALRSLGFYGEARTIQKKDFTNNPVNLEALDKFIAFTMLSARFLESEDLLTRRDKLNPASPHDFTESIAEVAGFVREHNFLDDDIEALMNLTLSVVHDAGFYPEDVHFSLRQDEESEWLSGWLPVAQPTKTVVDLNEKLAEVLSDAGTPAAKTSLINFMFVGA